MITSRVAARLVAISPQESPRLPQMSGWSSGYWGTSERAPARGLYASAASGGSETSRKSVNARAATDETERCSLCATPYNSRTSHPGSDKWTLTEAWSSTNRSARRGAPSRVGGSFFIIGMTVTADHRSNYDAACAARSTSFLVSACERISD